MEKSKINNMMLFKLREDGLYVLMPRVDGYYKNKYEVFYNKEKIQEGWLAGLIALDDFSKELLDNDDHIFDIVAIKQFESMNEVLHHVLNNIEPKEWDWVREEKKEVKSHRRELVDKVNGKKYGIEGEITPFKYNNQILRVGDIVEIKALDCDYQVKSFVCYDKFNYFIMGLKGSCDNLGNIKDWNIIGVKKYYDVKDNEVCGDLKMVNNEIKKVKLSLCKRSMK